MKKSKIFGWLGFWVVIASVVALGTIRSKGLDNSISITFLLMATGAIITFIAFFLGKRN